MKSQKIVSQKLLAALKADAGSNRELADQAGISFNTIAEAKVGFDPKELLGTRKRLGVVSSMTRLAAHLKLDPREVLRELGIDVADAAIGKQIVEVLRDDASRSRHEDPVLRAARARAITGAPPGPVMGIVRWSPFSDDTGGGSVARLLARSVLGSLNPEWDRETNVKPENDFMSAEKRLLSDDADKPDCLVGLYDLPWRRRGDVDVIALPGLYVKVGGLCTKPTTWKEVMTGRGEALPHALVIKGDIGDRLLTGPVDYPVGRLISPPLETYDPAEIAATIKHRIEKPPKDGFLFVADGPLVCAVKKRLPGPPDLYFLADQQEWAPAVRFGFAVRHDAERFGQLLEEAIWQDLLGRALPRTVHLYMLLLSLDAAQQTHQIGLDLVELERGEPGLEIRFIKIARELHKGDWRELLLGATRDKDHLQESIGKVLGNHTPATKR